MDYVNLGQVGQEINLIDDVDYLLIRDGFKWDEKWLDVISNLRGGGARIGKHLLATVDFDWDIFIQPNGGTGIDCSVPYESALIKLKALRFILNYAPRVSRTASPVYYTESVASQTTPLVYKVLSGTCVPIDRMLVQAGIIKCHLHLTFDGASIGGL